LRLRRRQVTAATDVASYIETITPLYPKFATLWTNVIWTLEHRADQIGEPLAGSSHIATVKLSADLPIVTLVFKLSEETVHITDCEFQFAR
jgi:hypothetical protein